MLMLSRASEVFRDDLYGVVTPEETKSWKPVSHSSVVETLTDRAAARGLVIKSERYVLLDGTLYGANGVQTRLPGARLFGSLDFAPIPGMPFPAGCAPSAGVRNSHDKSYTLSLLSGARVFLCAKRRRIHWSSNSPALGLFLLRIFCRSFRNLRIPDMRNSGSTMPGVFIRAALRS